MILQILHLWNFELNFLNFTALIHAASHDHIDIVRE